MIGKSSYVEETGGQYWLHFHIAAIPQMQSTDVRTQGQTMLHASSTWKGFSFLPWIQEANDTSTCLEIEGGGGLTVDVEARPLRVLFLHLAECIRMRIRR